MHFTIDLIARAGGDRVLRVMVVISDGADNESAIGIKEATEAALRNEVAVEVVDTFETDGRPMLMKLAESTGGLFWDGGNAKRTANAMAKIEQSLRSEYFVAYQPAGELSPGRFRKIQVKTHKASGRVAYRSGYFVPKSEAAMIGAENGPE